MMLLYSCVVALFVAILLGSYPDSLSADTLGFVSSPLVDHPVDQPLHARSAARWRRDVGSWGENLAEEMYRLNGYNEIHEIKAGGNRGFDRIAIKRGANGVMADAKFLEVKVNRSGRPRLNRTQFAGKQMSRKWLADNLRKMRNSGNPQLRDLASELSRYRKASGASIGSLGEIVHVNSKSGMITVLSSNGRVVKSVEPGARVLSRIQRGATGGKTSRWAARSLSKWHMIEAESMSSWLGKSVAQQNAKVVLRASSRGVAAAEQAVLRRSGRALTGKLLQRAAGPIGFVVAFGFDAKSLYDTETAYRSGAISIRQRNIGITSTIGGSIAAGAGSWAGAATGAWLGLSGGPFAEVTVPVGGLLGAVIGGVGGYWGGSTIAEYATMTWYASIDASVRDKFERSWLAMKGPNG